MGVGWTGGRGGWVGGSGRVPWFGAGAAGTRLPRPPHPATTTLVLVFAVWAQQYGWLQGPSFLPFRLAPGSVQPELAQQRLLALLALLVPQLVYCCSCARSRCRWCWAAWMASWPSSPSWRGTASRSGEWSGWRTEHAVGDGHSFRTLKFRIRKATSFLEGGSFTVSGKWSGRLAVARVGDGHSAHCKLWFCCGLPRF